MRFAFSRRRRSEILKPLVGFLEEGHLAKAWAARDQNAIKRVGLESSMQSSPEGPQKFATILSDMTQRLAVMDRYERRALSRRKLAIRAFDAARRRQRAQVTARRR